MAIVATFYITLDWPNSCANSMKAPSLPVRWCMILPENHGTMAQCRALVGSKSLTSRTNMKFTQAVKRVAKSTVVILVGQGILVAQTVAPAPNAVGLHLSRGHVLYRKGDLNGAIAEYRQALQLDPNEVAAHRGLGRALDRQGDPKGATAEFQEEVRVAPGRVFAHRDLADELFAGGDWGGAIREYREAIKLSGRDASLHEALAEALEENGDRQAALDEFKSANTLAPGDTTFQGSYVRLFSELHPGAQPDLATKPTGPNAGGIYTPGGDVTEPVAVYRPNPSYTKEARKRKLSGAVSLALIVDAQGNVTDVHVVSPLGMGLDENAIKTVSTWKFKPATRKGKAVPVEVYVEFSFHLF